MAKNKTLFNEELLKSKGYFLMPNGSYAREISGSGYKIEANYIKQHVDELTFLSINSKPLIVFDITPIGAPRMTRSDTWKLDPNHADERKRQRKPVTQYFRFMKEIQALALQKDFKLPENGFHVIFIVPMPHSWSDKKKNQMNSTPHQQKPDADNMIKAVKDSLCENDANIWDYRITKYWGRGGKIVIYNID